MDVVKFLLNLILSPAFYCSLIASVALNLAFGYIYQLDPYYDEIMKVIRSPNIFDVLPHAITLFSFGTSVLLAMLLYEYQKQPTLLNSAFVFVKPPANTPATRALVKKTLTDAKINILSEGSIDGKEIDDKKLIDQHYYAIASKATIMPAKDIPVPADKFKSNFNEEWDVVLKEGRAVNAMEACKKFNCTPDELNAVWTKCQNVVKFGGGFYCAKLSMKDQELYVFNAFFMAMRSKFVGETKSIHYFVVEWDASKLKWKDFRGEILGSTDPYEAAYGSIRKQILQRYLALGIKEKPNKGDNGVHASASPLEGLGEKANWLGIQYKNDAFGQALLESGIKKSVLDEWCKDARVYLPNESQKGSIFDACEDLDAKECLQKLIAINSLN